MRLFLELVHFFSGRRRLHGFYGCASSLNRDADYVVSFLRDFGRGGTQTIFLLLHIINWRSWFHHSLFIHGLERIVVVGRESVDLFGL